MFRYDNDFFYRMPASWELALKTYIPEPAGWQKYLFSLTFLIQKINSVNKKTGLAAFWPILAIIFFNIIDIIKNVFSIY